MQYCNWRSKTAGLDSCFIFEGDTVEIDTSINGYRFLDAGVPLLPNVGEWDYLNRMGRNYKYATPTGALKDTFSFNNFKDYSDITKYPLFPFGFKCAYYLPNNGLRLGFSPYFYGTNFTVFTATGGYYTLDDSTRAWNLQMIRRIKTDPRDSAWFTQNKLIRAADTNGYGQPPSNWP
jgi:hypothetical protein